MTDKLFTVGGVSKHEGEYKVRFANDMTRVKILSKRNDDVNLMELPQAMTKPDVVTFLKTTNLYENPLYKAAIDTADIKYNAVSVKSVKVKAAPSLAAIKARAVEAEAETV